MINSTSALTEAENSSQCWYPDGSLMNNIWDAEIFCKERSLSLSMIRNFEMCQHNQK